VPPVTALIKVMQDAARKAAKGLVRDFGELENLQVSRKGLADFVSAADTKAERVLRDELTKARPGYGFLGEETGLTEGTDKTHTWIVDPLDGTTNFLHAIPHFAINIGLQREGQVVAGVTYNPISNEMFWAERGKGAYLNDRRLRVSQRRTLEDSLLVTGIPYLGHGQQAKFLKELHQIAPRVAGVRRFGAASLDMAYVAAGKFDGYWERDLKAWDLAAGLVLVAEAGGKVTSADGEEDVLGPCTVLAANLEVHPLVLERIRAAA
jgi:myo-inositol-1(or 4)-monophosphatase